MKSGLFNCGKNFWNNFYSTILHVTYIALLKALVSLQMGKMFSSDNKVSVDIMYSIHVLAFTLAYSYDYLISLTSLNLYECFMNTGYLCAGLKKISYNLSLKKGHCGLAGNTLV